MSTNKKPLAYNLLKKVPKGKVVSYGELARAFNNMNEAQRASLHLSPRAVGAFMRCNADTKNIPCYKVVHSDGSVGNYSGGIKKKIRLMKKDGIEIKNGKIGKKYLFRFK